MNQPFPALSVHFQRMCSLPSGGPCSVRAACEEFERNASGSRHPHGRGRARPSLNGFRMFETALLLAASLLVLPRSAAAQDDPAAPAQDAATAPAAAPTAAQTLLAAFESVPSLSCEIRRDSSAPDRSSVRTLSRVFFERPDRLHSENVLPIHRRTVCDGTVLRQYVDSLPRGFSRPVSALPPDMLVNLRMLPGSNANWLEPLRDLPETALPPAPDAPRRAAYAHSNAFVVLSFDADGHWFRFERFTSPDMTDRTLSAEFSDFREVAPSVFIPARQTVSALVSGTLFRDEIRISALSTDPVPPSLFDSAAFFPNVEFTDSFEKTLSP